MSSHQYVVRPEFQDLRAGACLQKLLDACSFETVLDVGSGAGAHARMFEKYGKVVTAVDFGSSVYYRSGTGDRPPRRILIGDYNTLELDTQFDAVWASHVLEHQPNVNQCLRKMHRDLRDGGWLAVTVPPLKHEIVGGHVTLWNGGLLLYNLIMAGFDCRDAMLLKHNYNISVIAPKRPIDLPPLDYDSGDIERLARFFPMPVHEGFFGDIEEINWMP